LIEKFTIRLMPKQNEIFSAYLARVAHANFISISELISYVTMDSIAHNCSISSRAFYLDTTSLSQQELIKISYLLGIEKSRIINMTFINVYKKWLNSDEEQINDYKNVLRYMLIKDERRFCPECLRDNEGYPMLWQIKEIEICDKHNSMLTSICKACGERQPYITNSTSEYMCYKCGRFLYEQESTKGLEPTFVNEQLRYYKDWHYLLNNNTQIISNINVNKGLVGIAIAYIYIAHIYNINDKLENRFINRLINSIKKNSLIEYVTVNRLLSLIRKINYSLEEFHDLVIPDLFIDSLIHINYDHQLGPCLAPWCLSYGTNRHMKEINQFRCKIGKYKYASVCMSCFMKYGYSRMNNEWNSIDDEINTIWYGVKPLLETGMTPSAIVKKLGRSPETIFKAVGYLSYNKLINASILSKYTPLNISHDIRECFQILTSAPGKRMKNAYDLFGWKKAEYYYYHAMKEVQEFLLFDSNKEIGMKRKIHRMTKKDWTQDIENCILFCIENDITISIEGISEMLKVSCSTLNKHKINEVIHEAIKKQKLVRIEQLTEKLKIKVRLLFNLKEQKVEIINCSEVCFFLNKSSNWIKDNIPGLYQWIKEKVNKHNESIKEIWYNKKILAIKKTIEKLKESDKPVTYISIAEESGISKTFFCRNQEIQDIIRSLKMD